MKKLVVILSGLLLLLLGGVVLVGVLSFFGAAVTNQEISRDESAAPAAMTSAPADFAAADQESALQEKVAAPAAESSVQRVAASAPLPSAGFAADGKVIRNGTLSIVVESPATAVAGVEKIIAGIPGAFIATAEVRQLRERQPSMFTLRVPAEAFDQAMSALRALAQEVLVEQVAARDVTEEYTDLDARLRNLQAAETQLLTFLEKAEAVDDLLKVEKRLAEVRQEIEQLQGRVNVLENRIALATIHLLLHALPDISVEIAALDLPSAHAVTAFALTYRNVGSVTARDGSLTLHVPERLSVIEVGNGGSYDPTAREIQWILADLPPGIVGTFHAHLRVETTEGDIQLSAEIQSASVDADYANNTDSMTLTFAPDLALEVDGPASGAQGSELSIWINLSNVGTANATDVTVQTILPTGLTFVRADSGGSYEDTSRTVEWKLGRLQAGMSGHVRMDVRVDVGEGRLEVPVSVAAEQTDAVDFNNRTEVLLTALREDVSDRSIWQPGQTVAQSLAALVVVARAAVDVLIWVLTFGIPLAIIGLLGLGARAGIRRLRRRRAAGARDES